MHSPDSHDDGGNFYRMVAKIFIVFGVVFVMLVLVLRFAHAGHPGQNWEEIEPDPAVRAWIATLLQPDSPIDHPMSCCGDSDAYWADLVTVEDDAVYATVDDDRDDVKLGRVHVPNGTRFKIPPNKLVGQRQRGNPSGHGIIFLGTVYWAGGYTAQSVPPAAQRAVLCYVGNSGF